MILFYNLFDSDQKALVEGGIFTTLFVCFFSLTLPGFIHEYLPTNMDRQTGLLIGYAGVFFSLLALPVSTFFMTKPASQYPEKVFSLSILGISVCSILIAFAPKYDSFGLLGFIMITLLKFVCVFCSRSKLIVSFMVVLKDHKSMSRPKWYSYSNMIYSVITIFATFCAAYVCTQNHTHYIKYFFIIFGVFGIFLYSKLTFLTKNFSFNLKIKQQKKRTSVKVILHSILLVPNFAVSTISYALPFSVFPPLLYVMHPHHKLGHILYGTCIIIALGIPMSFLASKLINKFSCEKLAKISAIMMAIYAPFLLYELQFHPTLTPVTIIGILLFFGNSLFSIPNSNWIAESIKKISYGVELNLYASNFSGLVIGGTKVFISLLIYKLTGNSLWVGVYLSVMCLITLWSMPYHKKIHKQV